jgi:hypothetical protein
MLHPVLSSVCDRLARSTVMRSMDEQELQNFGDDATHSSVRREQWRAAAEHAALRDLRAFISDDARLEREVVCPFRATQCVREAEDEALAVAYALTRTSFEANPFRKTPEVAALFNINSAGGRVFAALEVRKKPAAMVEQMMLELLQPDDLGVRPLLLEAARTWRVLLLLFQRWIGENGLGARRGCDVAGAIAQHLDRRRAQFNEQLAKCGGRSRPPAQAALAMPPRASSSLELRSVAAASSSSHAAGQRPAAALIPPRPESQLQTEKGAAAPTGSSRGRRAAWAAAAPEVAATWTSKWSRAPRVFVCRMQACFRRRLAARKVRAMMTSSKSPASQRHALHQQKRAGLVDSLTKAYNAQLPDALKLYETLRYLGREDDRLERFYTTEEDEFNSQWQTYVKKMTNFFLKECPLDVDWVRQVQPQTQRPYFLNVKSGKVQEENPNALKVVAAKNRQWLKAVRAREDRLSEARKRVDQLNEMRQSELPLLERRLTVPIFL